MALICLPKFAADEFKRRLKDGSIDPRKLSEISSAERRTFFESFLNGDEAKLVNSTFESKLLLKNQQQGMINWAQKTAGMKPAAKRDILDKVMKLEKALDPVDEAAFLADLAEQKLGVGVTLEEAQTITNLAREVDRIKTSEGPTSIEYGRARVAFENYVGELKSEAAGMRMSDFKDNPIGASAKLVTEAAGTSKAIKASLDNSAVFRQGWKVMLTNPTIWAKNAADTFRNLVRQFGGRAVMDEVKADIYSRENFDLYKKAKLAIGVTEEAFPTRLPEKVPGLGRFYKASETAFTTFQYKNRVDLFDKYIDIAKKSGVDVSSTKELQSIGQLVNSLTGRGNLGSLEPIANTVNNIFFSPRFVKSQIDTLGGQILSGGEGSNFVRKQAAINLVKVVSGTAAILVIADAVLPGSVEWDPRSSDFGQIKIGDTRFDVSGGSRSLVTLAARLALQSTKSTTSGKIRELDSGDWGSKQGADVAYDFFSNKLSPASAMVNTMVLRGNKDFKGDDVTAMDAIADLTVPLPVSNFMESKDNPEAANMLLILIADGLGIGTNTYEK